MDAVNTTGISLATFHPLAEESAKVADSHLRGFSYKLTPTESERFNAILDQTSEFMSYALFHAPVPGKPAELPEFESLMNVLRDFFQRNPIKFPHRELIKFVTKQLNEKHFKVGRPIVAGGAEKSVMAKTPFMDTDVSISLNCSDFDTKTRHRAYLEKIYFIYADFIVQKLEESEIALTMEKQYFIRLCAQFMEYYSTVFTETSKTESRTKTKYLHIPFGQVDFKLIVDSKYRGTCATTDAFCGDLETGLVYAENDRGECVDEQTFNSYLSDLTHRLWVFNGRPKKESGLLFRVSLGRLHGFKIVDKTIVNLALAQFKDKFGDDASAVYNKLYRYFRTHCSDAMSQQFAFLDLLGLMLCYEDCGTQNKYVSMVAGAWEKYPPEQTRFQGLASALKIHPQLAQPILQFIRGIYFLEFLKKNPGVNAFTFDFCKKVEEQPRYQLSIKVGCHEHFLDLPELNPVLFIVEFLKAWMDLEKNPDCPNLMVILNELGLRRDKLDVKDVIVPLLQVLDAPHFLEILTKYFPTSNPNLVITWIETQFPDVVDKQLIMRKRLLIDLWVEQHEAKRLHHPEIAGLCMRVRDLLSKRSQELPAEIISEVAKVLKSDVSATAKAAIRRGFTELCDRCEQRGVLADRISELREEDGVAILQCLMEQRSHALLAVVWQVYSSKPCEYRQFTKELLQDLAKNGRVEFLGLLKKVTSQRILFRFLAMTEDLGAIFIPLIEYLAILNKRKLELSKGGAVTPQDEELMKEDIEAYVDVLWDDIRDSTLKDHDRLKLHTMWALEVTKNRGTFEAFQRTLALDTKNAYFSLFAALKSFENCRENQRNNLFQRLVKIFKDLVSEGKIDEMQRNLLKELFEKILPKVSDTAEYYKVIAHQVRAAFSKK